MITSVALINSNEVCYEENSQLSGNHDEVLAELVEKLFIAANIAPAELDKIVIGEGPGSFTGLRIGFSFAKGLALGLHVPIFQTSSLQAACYEFIHQFQIFFSIEDARRDEVYFSAHLKNVDGLLLKISDFDLIRKDETMSTIESLISKHQLSPSQAVIISSSELDFIGAGIQLKKPLRLANGLFKSVRHLEQFNDLYFDLEELVDLEPKYVRGLSAKTILEREKERVLQ